MASPLLRRAAPALLLLALLSSIACGGGALPAPPTPDQPVTLEPATPAPTQPGATSTPVPPPPPTATLPSSGLQFNPPQIGQGGFAIVYLNESATSATLRFEGRQYPMLNADGRWWTIIGVGALISPGLHPVSVTYTPTGRTTQTSVTQSINILDVVYPVESITLDPDTAALLAPEIVNAEIAHRAAIYGGFTAQKLWSGPWVAPAKGSYSDAYGVGRSYNGSPVTDYHRGTDFIGDIGSAVSAAATGRVVFAGELKVRGNSIIIDHGAGVFTGYHHLSAFAVAEGDIVAAGERIGDVGSTGLVTGPHLHWDVVVRGVEVDGKLFLTGAEVTP